MSMVNSTSAPEVAADGATLPLVCDLTAIDDATRPAHLERATYLLGPGAQERQELPDGYAFRYAADDFALVAEFIVHERRCCPFFHFVLDVPPAQAAIWLRITGPADIKTLLETSLGPQA